MNHRLLAKVSLLNLTAFVFTLLLCTVGSRAQSASSSSKADRPIFVRCGTLIAGKSPAPRKNVLVEIANGKFRAITNYPQGFVPPVWSEIHRPVF